MFKVHTLATRLPAVGVSSHASSPFLVPMSSSLPLSVRPRLRPLGVAGGDRSWVVFGNEALPVPTPDRVLRVRDGLTCWVDVLPGRTKNSPPVVRVFWCGNLAWIGLRPDRDSLVPHMRWSSILTYCDSSKPGGRKTEKNHTSISSILRINPEEKGSGLFWDNHLGMASTIVNPISWSSEVGAISEYMRVHGVDHPLNLDSWKRSLHSVALQNVDVSRVAMVTSENPDQAQWAHALAQQVIAGDLPSVCDPVSGVSPLMWTLRTWNLHTAVLTFASKVCLQEPKKMSPGVFLLKGKRLNTAEDDFPSLSCAAAILAAADSSQKMDDLPRALVGIRPAAVPFVLKALSDRVRLQKRTACRGFKEVSREPRRRSL
jgi:hypothetical protein